MHKSRTVYITLAPACSNIFAYFTVRCTSSNIRILHVMGTFSSRAHRLTAINAFRQHTGISVQMFAHFSIHIQCKQNLNVTGIFMETCHY